MKKARWNLVASGIVLGAFCSSAGAVILYTITDLGTLGGSNSAALSINNNGQIVGYAYDSSNTNPYATLFDPTGGGNNRTLKGSGAYASKAYSINDNGQIVGCEYSNSGVQCATIFDSSGNGSSTYLGSGAGAETMACSINNNGQIVGEAGNYYPTLFDPTGNGNNINLGNLSGGSDGVALCVNDSGQIVGWSGNSQGRIRPLLLDPTGNRHNIDLGTLGGPQGGASCINNRGQIVGSADTSDQSYDSKGLRFATLYDATGNGNNLSLGAIGAGRTSCANWINNNGQAVGYGYDSGSLYNPCAILFDTTGHGNNVNLNNVIIPSGWQLENAHCINDNGYIIGEGLNPQGQYHAFLLTPVPEPATLSLLAFGTTAFLRRRGAA